MNHRNIPNTRAILKSRAEPGELLRLNCLTHKCDSIILLDKDGKREWRFGRHKKNDVVIDYSQRISKVHFIISVVSGFFFCVFGLRVLVVE